jgi:hypothetical protein
LDLEYLANGEPMAVSARRRLDSRLQPGVLILNMKAENPVMWHRGVLSRPARVGVPMRVPIQVDSVSEVTGADAWRLKSGMNCIVEAHADGEPWTLAVPIFDLDLVLIAFETAGTH